MSKIERSWDGFLWCIREGFPDINVLRNIEYSVLKLFTLLGQKDKTFVDVGAHVGYYSIRMSKLYGRVIAIEPNPYSIECLKRNIELNNAYNVEVIPVACGDKDEELMLAGLRAWAYISSGTGEIRVQVKRLDGLVEHADVLKIDVEGFEEQVIRGSLNLISKCKPVIVIEHHDLMGFNIPDANKRIKNILKDYGYRRFNLDDIRYAYVHEDQLSKLSKNIISMLIIRHWFSKMLHNILDGRPWYYGLPYTWWHGMTILDVLENLPEHLTEEIEWFEKIKDD